MDLVKKMEKVEIYNFYQAHLKKLKQQNFMTVLYNCIEVQLIRTVTTKYEYLVLAL